jgi:hypothetical protein
LQGSWKIRKSEYRMIGCRNQANRREWDAYSLSGRALRETALMRVGHRGEPVR